MKSKRLPFVLTIYQWFIWAIQTWWYSSIIYSTNMGLVGFSNFNVPLLTYFFYLTLSDSRCFYREIIPFFVLNSNVVYICLIGNCMFFFFFFFSHLLPQVGWWWNKRTFWTCTRVLLYCIIFSSPMMLL